MKEFDPKREFLFDYITVVAECTFAIAVIGSLFARNNSIRFIYFFLAVWVGTYLYDSMYSYLSEGRYDDSTDYVAERYRACCSGNRNVCGDLSYYGRQCF